ncbi:nucleotide sugar dehydrogenase [bacterium]|nr:nucleotide sugar dehydrogenase [bacterium]
MNTNKIGIVGQGFVGSAVREGFLNHVEVLAYDKDPSKNTLCNSLESLVKKTDVIFVCLPTPMRKSGECDLSIVDKVIHEIDKIANDINEEKIAIIKSTVPPGTTNDLNSSVSKIQIVFNPEFLTEANHIDDFKNQTRIIIGGPRPASTIVKSIFRKVFPTVPIIKTGSNTAEMVKYFTNCFLATKVTFANEMFKVCQKIDVDYDKVTEYALHDKRIGRSHLSVPGPDGDFGFGGHCFPKDLNAIIYLCEKLGVDSLLLTAVNDKNNKLRSDRDWEKMAGRAVSEE